MKHDLILRAPLLSKLILVAMHFVEAPHKANGKTIYFQKPWHGQALKPYTQPVQNNLQKDSLSTNDKMGVSIIKSTLQQITYAL